MFVIVVLFWVEFWLVVCFVVVCQFSIPATSTSMRLLMGPFFFDGVLLFVCFFFSVCSKCFWYPQKTNWFHPLRGCRRLQAGDSLQVESQSRSGIPGTGLEI